MAKPLEDADERTRRWGAGVALLKWVGSVALLYLMGDHIVERYHPSTLIEVAVASVVWGPNLFADDDLYLKAMASLHEDGIVGRPSLVRAWYVGLEPPTQRTLHEYLTANVEGYPEWSADQQLEAALMAWQHFIDELNSVEGIDVEALEPAQREYAVTRVLQEMMGSEGTQAIRHPEMRGALEEAKGLLVGESSDGS